MLEASFGTGYLMLQYAGHYDTYGIDYNASMVAIARQNLSQKGIQAHLQRANVEQLPFPDGFFDTVVNTMAFSGYPDGRRAMAELFRVLKRGGKLLMVDFEYPSDRNMRNWRLLALITSTSFYPRLDSAGGGDRSNRVVPKLSVSPFS